MRKFHIWKASACQKIMHHNKVIIRTTIFKVCPEKSQVSDILQGVSGQNNFLKAKFGSVFYSYHRWLFSASMRCNSTKC